LARFVPYKNYFYNQFHGMSSLVVCSVGCEQSPPGFVHGPNVRKFYTLHYCMKGTGALTMNGKTYTVHPGDLLLIYPNVKVYPKADHRNPWELSWVGFSGSDARLLTDAIGFSPFRPVLSLPAIANVHDLIMDIYDHKGDLPAEVVGMTARLYTCFSFLMERTHHAFPSNPGSEYVQRACDFISSHYGEKLTVDDIASHVGVSRSCLYRSFMANMSVSPLDYLTEHRVKASCNLLGQGGLSMKEIAYSCGFSNALYYSTVFKKVMGISPTDYLSHVSR